MSQGFHSMDDSIPVFFCTDDYYAVPTYIALYSLLKNYRYGRKLKVYVLTPNSFTQKNIDLFIALKKDFSNLDIQIIGLKTNYDSVKTHNMRISSVTLYRLMIPRFINELDKKVNKCIYIDSDVIVEGNIGEMFNIDVKNYYVAGVIDHFLSDNNHIDLKKIIKIPSLEGYINAGVLIMNVKKIIDEGVSGQLEEAGYQEEYLYNDQDAINSVFYGNIKHIPLKYNINISCLPDDVLYEKYGVSNVKEAKTHPVIIHYNTWEKPWIYRHMKTAEIWWKYIRMQNETVMREFIEPFLKANRIPLLEEAGKKLYHLYYEKHASFVKRIMRKKN